MTIHRFRLARRSKPGKIDTTRHRSASRLSWSRRCGAEVGAERNIGGGRPPLLKGGCQDRQKSADSQQRSNPSTGASCRLKSAISVEGFASATTSTHTTRWPSPMAPWTLSSSTPLRGAHHGEHGDLEPMIHGPQIESSPQGAALPVASHRRGWRAKTIPVPQLGGAAEADSALSGCSVGRGPWPRGLDRRNGRPQGQEAEAAPLKALPWK